MRVPGNKGSDRRRLTAVAALLLGCSSGPATMAPSDDVPASVDAPAVVDVPADVDPVLTRGLAVFRRYCATCHGVRGTGSTDGPDLTQEVPMHTDEEVQTIIREGSRLMPRLNITDQQRADVYAYLRATFGPYEGP